MLVAAAFSTTLFATSQAPEYLIYNGRQYYLYKDLLYEYIKKHPEKRPASPYGYGMFDLIRGYIATYEIRNNELLLNDIGTVTGRTIVGDPILESVLPEFLAEQSVLKIDWFSGFLIIPENDRRRKFPCEMLSIAGGGPSNYENYILIEIKNGDFVKEKRMNCLELQQFMRGGSWEQYPEYLIYKTKEFILYNDLLYEYFKKYPEKQPKSLVESSSLRRGYIATYEIKNNELFLKDIGVHVDKREYGKLVLKSILPEFLAGQPALKIDWFSGFLAIPNADLRKKRYMPCVVPRMILGGGITSHYEYYTLIEIKDGNFVREIEMNCFEYRQFRNMVFKENYDDYDDTWNDEWCEKMGGCASRELLK
jgi:hypothetical protein